MEANSAGSLINDVAVFVCHTGSLRAPFLSLRVFVPSHFPTLVDRLAFPFIRAVPPHLIDKIDENPQKATWQR